MTLILVKKYSEKKKFAPACGSKGGYVWSGCGTQADPGFRSSAGILSGNPCLGHGIKRFIAPLQEWVKVGGRAAAYVKKGKGCK